MKIGAGLRLIVMLVSISVSKLSAEELVVAVKPALVFRESPDLKAKIVDKIPYGEKITVLNRNGPAANLMGLSHRWYQIRYAGKSGWAFGAFLQDAKSRKFYEIVSGKAHERDPAQCIQFKAADFPKFFSGGSGKWKRSDNKVLIEYAVLPQPPADICSYRDGSAACIREEEQKNLKECGKKNGCVLKMKRVLELPQDDQFTLDGKNACIYP